MWDRGDPRPLAERVERNEGSAVATERWQDFWTYVEGLSDSIRDSSEAHDRDRVHVEVVDERERLGRDALAVLHEGLQEVHERQVARSDGEGHVVARHGRDTGFVPELRDVVSDRAERLHFRFARAAGIVGTGRPKSGCPGQVELRRGVSQEAAVGVGEMMHSTKRNAKVI